MIVNDTGFGFGHAHCFRIREELLRLQRAPDRSSAAPRRGGAGRRDGTDRDGAVGRGRHEDRTISSPSSPASRAALPRQHDGARTAPGHGTADRADGDGDAGRRAGRARERDRRRRCGATRPSRRTARRACTCRSTGRETSGRARWCASDEAREAARLGSRSHVRRDGPAAGWGPDTAAHPRAPTRSASSRRGEDRSGTGSWPADPRRSAA